jgi:hypothetical protein
MRNEQAFFEMKNRATVVGSDATAELVLRCAGFERKTFS